MVRTVLLVFLSPVLANWTHVDRDVQRFSNSVEVAGTVVDASDQAAGRDMEVGRFYIGKRDYTAAIGRHFGRPGNRFWPALYGGGANETLVGKTLKSRRSEFTLTVPPERAR